MTRGAHERHRRWLQKAGILTTALPYMQRYASNILVIKIGGNALEEAENQLATHFAHDIVLLKQVGIHPIIVHGGGTQIDRFAEKIGIKQQRIDGLRITNKETRDCAAMVLAKLGKSIVGLIQQAGGTAVALSGQDANLMLVHKTKPIKDKSGSMVDLGFVGTPNKVEPSLLFMLIKAGLIPVLAPIASDGKGEIYNINADAFAGALAVGTGAKRLMMMTDVAGVRDAQERMINELDEKQIKQLVKEGTINSGMIPKINTCLSASKGGVTSVILDGRVPHTILLELFTESGTGSLIHAQKNENKT